MNIKPKFDEAKTETLQLRVTPTMKQKLKAIAKSENRSVSNLIDSIVIKKIEEYKDIIDTVDGGE